MKRKKNINTAKEVINLEIAALNKLKKNLNNSNFNAANKEYLKTVGEQNYRNLVVKSFVSKK